MPGPNALTGAVACRNHSLKVRWNMNAHTVVRRIIAIAALTTVAGTTTIGFAERIYVPAGDINRLIWGDNPPSLNLFGEPAYYYGWPPHRVYPQNGKITIEYAKCEPLNWEITVPNQAWKRADRATQASHHSFLLTRHHPDITISLAGEPLGVEEKNTNRTVLINSQAKMKVLLGATILRGERPLSGRNIQGIAYFANAEHEGVSVHYAMWVASRNGYNYSLAVYGDKKYSGVINGEMFDFVRDLKQINPNRVAHADTKLKLARRHLDGSQKSPPAEPRPFSEPLVK